MNLSLLLSLFYIEMNYAFDLWKLQDSQNSIGQIDYFQQAFSLNQYFFSAESDQNSKQFNSKIIAEPNCITLQVPQIDELLQSIEFEPKELAIPSKIHKNLRNSSEKQKKKKQIKSSPYHNYQKHLNHTLKQLITLDTLSFQKSQKIQVAHKLWDIFTKNQSSTKKILNFIFNEFNQYPFKENDLLQFGFKEIYSTTPAKLLAQARVYLTKIAINYLNEEGIDRYLQTRRIRNPLKFKKYLMVFRKELQDGFLKKRFTNRSRKEQLRKLREKESETSQ